MFFLTRRTFQMLLQCIHAKMVKTNEDIAAKNLLSACHNCQDKKRVSKPGFLFCIYLPNASQSLKIRQQKIPFSLCFIINTLCKAFFLLRFERYSSFKETLKRIWPKSISFLLYVTYNQLSE